MNTPTRFCPDCGAAIEPSNRFCGGCGKPLADLPPPTAQATPTIQAPVITASGSGDLPIWVWLLLGLAAAAGMVALLYFFMLKDIAPGAQRQTAVVDASAVIADIAEDEIKLDNIKDAKIPGQGPVRLPESRIPVPKGKDGDLIDRSRPPLLTDDFSTASGIWQLRSDAKATREIKNGALEIGMLADRGSAQIGTGKNWRNIATEISAKALNGAKNFSYGLVVRKQADGESFIVCAITNTGEYAIIQRENGKNKTLVRAQSAALKTGMESNTLLVQTFENYLTFTINGQIAEVLETSGTMEGDISVIVVQSQSEAADRASVAFDNFKLWEQKR